MRQRIRSHHLGGNAAGSPLRLTLGCLLAEELGIELRRVGSGKRRTFHTGEPVLTEWIKENALVSWVEHDQPWELERELIESLDVPLNLQGNVRNAYHPKLTEIRLQAALRARELPMLPNPGRRN
ncbi:GIY-YIG nuclease family protein [Williamsia muralis]|uniref:GIY-YIG nuclease family protein n=1 Tax=Williamsia marianensis TaxID=85044 RepID=UPI003F5CCEC4